MPDGTPLKVNPGDAIKAKSWNALVDAAYTPDVSAGDGLQLNNWGSGNRVAMTKQPDDYWVGKVTTAGPNGEANFTDCRYWVTREKLTTNADSAKPYGTEGTTYACNQQYLCEFQKKLTWADATVPYAQTIVATNIMEQVANCHFLTVGQLVHVFEEFDAGSPTYIRYKFSCTPPSFFGKIESGGPCGQSDYTDNRYWVQKANAGSSSWTATVTETLLENGTANPCQSSACSPASDCASKNNNAQNALVTVTNFAESNLAISQKSHLLDIGTLVEVFWGPDASGNPAYWMDVTPAMRIGTYCPTNDTSGNPCGVNDTLDQYALSFHVDDFALSNCTAQPWRTQVDWNGFTVIGNAYTTAPKVCNVKIIELDDTGQASVPADATVVEPTANSNKYNLKWHLTSTPEADPCAGCADPAEKPTAHLSGYIYVNPCDYGYMHIQNCSTAIDGTYQIVQFHKGLKVTASGMCTDTIPNRAVVDLDLTVGTGDPYLTMDYSSSCGAVINLYTHEECLITGFTVSGDCGTGYTVTAATKTIVVLGAS